MFIERESPANHIWFVLKTQIADLGSLKTHQSDASSIVIAKRKGRAMTTRPQIQ
jgi:hypothetical protein